ncbi:MAG TPA: class I SAM-dependent methyltransferase [Mycobacterium sp.]|nr:class I SAM-dependent methyltransferase [Mycobacterium sp.]
MARTDHDAWDITHSVGVTALLVAAARDAETVSENPLISDPFARVFLDAAGEGIWSVYADAALTDDAGVRVRARAMTDFMAVRTLFFDEFFSAATDAGLRQTVILASGLDSRAWRLRWPAGATIYELDQPKVLDFKSAALQRHGAQPTSNIVYVPVDLRQDWPQALCDAGFDPASPTAWSAEGLLRYLPARAQDLLFERIHALSAAGSRLATNAVSPQALDPDRLARQRDQMRRLHAAAARLLDTEPPDLGDLWYAEERTDVAGWLTEHGWDTSTTSLGELLARHGRSDDAEDMTPNLLISARRTGQSR